MIELSVSVGVGVFVVVGVAVTVAVAVVVVVAVAVGVGVPVVVDVGETSFFVGGHVTINRFAVESIILTLVNSEGSGTAVTPVRSFVIW